MERETREPFLEELMRQLREAIQTAPTTEEARKRQIYESRVGLAGGNRLVFLNLDGRIALQPGEYETARAILARLGLSEEKIEGIVTHEKEHTEKARELGMRVAYLFVSLARNEKGKHTVALETIMVGESHKAALEVIRAPQNLSQTDRDILQGINEN